MINTINNKQISLLEKIFNKWDNFSALNYYKNPFFDKKWNIIYIHTEATPNKILYESLILFLSKISCNSFYTITTTTIYNHHDILLKNKISDSYEKYCEELQTSYIRYDNYFIFGEIALWGISYNIDTEILTLGFDNSIKVIVESCFQGKKLIISSQLADKINHDILNYKFNEYHLE